VGKLRLSESAREYKNYIISYGNPAERAIAMGIMDARRVGEGIAQ